MAISTVTNRVAYQGDGSSAVFNFPYRVDAQTDLGVYTFNSSVLNGPLVVPQVLNTNFTFSGQADAYGNYVAGGNLIFNSSPNAQTQIVIFRSSVVTSDYSVGQFDSVSGPALTNETDYLTMLLQRAQDLATRSVRLNDGFYGPGFDPTLPLNVQQCAGWAVVINSSATGFILTPVGSTLFTGILPIQYGGTGTNSTFSLGSLIFAGSGGIYGRTQQMYFDTTANTLYIGSSLAASQFIGGNLSVTGNETLGGSLTVGSNVTLGGFAIDRPLRSTVTGEIGVGSTNLNTEVTGILGIAQGGTGTSTSYIQYGLIYASSATQFGTVPSSTSGFVLIANGSSAPSFQNLSATNVTTTKTANYITGQTDRYIFLNSSLFTVTLERPTSAGKEISIKRIVLDSTSLGQRQIIAGSGALLGLVGSTTLDTYGEELNLKFDGTAWQYNRIIPTQWTSWNTTYNGLGTVASSVTEWRRDSDSMEFRQWGIMGTVTGGTSYMTMPTGLNIAPVPSTNGRAQMLGFGFLAAAGGDRYVMNFRDYNLLFLCPAQSPMTPTTGAAFGNTGTEFSMTGKVQVLGWNGV